MAIPGRTLDRLETRAKVKIGEKRKTAKGKEYPAAVDYFVCADPEFKEICGDKPKTIRIVLPYSTAEENFSTGLERWKTAKQSGNQVLTCYTHDGSSNPVALRLTDFVQGWDEVRGPERGQNRTPVTCRADDCPFWKDKSCKPMGRLQFLLEGGRSDTALQIDTKSWNTIEQISGALASVGRVRDLRGTTWELSVAFQTKGADRFPVITIKEADVPINESDLTLADAFVQAQGALGRKEEDSYRQHLATLLDLTNEGWREKPEFIERIKEVGVEAALTGTLARIEGSLS